jgi:hypothetical protein
MDVLCTKVLEDIAMLPVLFWRNAGKMFEVVCKVALIVKARHPVLRVQSVFLLSSFFWLFQPGSIS